MILCDSCRLPLDESPVLRPHGAAFHESCWLDIHQPRAKQRPKPPPPSIPPEEWTSPILKHPPENFAPRSDSAGIFGDDRRRRGVPTRRTFRGEYNENAPE